MLALVAAALVLGFVGGHLTSSDEADEPAATAVDSAPGSATSVAKASSASDPAHAVVVGELRSEMAAYTALVLV